MKTQDLAKQLLEDADELEGCGAGNEAGRIRDAAGRLERSFAWPDGVHNMTHSEFEEASGWTIGARYVYDAPPHSEWRKPTDRLREVQAAIAELGPLDRDRVAEVLRLDASLADRFAGDSESRARVYRAIADLVEGGQ